MSIREEEIFLAKVLELIDRKMAELDARVDITDKDMADFHEYFWNSYTEFDEYGYELYDNTNAIRQKIMQKADYIREKFSYERMKDSPYFGRVDFVFDGESEPVPCYIGISNLSESAGMMPLVYDWRAPISSLFYDYDAGPAAYDAPAGRITGRITHKYQYKISSGHIVYMLESDMNIDDEILRAELGSHASASLKAIVTTIQREQNAIIRDTGHRILAVQGCAGSGKTSVALHRIAYLLYHNRNTLKASQILILSPNYVFADYISRILPELGEENICEMSLDVWAYRRLRKYGEAQDRYDRLEEILSPDIHPSHASTEADYKQSEDYVRELDGFILSLEYDGVDIRDYRYRGRKVKADYISSLFYEKLWDVPFMERMNRIAEFIIDEEETLRGRDMSVDERAYITDSLNAMYVDRDLLSLYNAFLASSGRNELPAAYVTPEGSPDDGEDGESESADDMYDETGSFVYVRKKATYLRAELIPYEDVYPLLYLKYSLFFHDTERSVKHLVIDEMQDYTYLQYRLIEKVFPCAMTILGDKAQTIDCEHRDVLKFLPRIFGSDLYTVQMDKSYRSTVEITTYAAGIVGLDTVSNIDRHGEPVGEHEFRDDEDLIAQLKYLIAQYSPESDTIAVLCRDAFRSGEIYDSLAGIDREISLLTSDTSLFKTGVSVAPFYLTKGLEFDTVFVIDEAFEPMDLHRQALYIETTRALHVLHIFRPTYGGEL
ncbi:MAG: AAA family ATPase [Lachnospiraceae bacterium]|nr:AAA family ATPase [Lachnospiraceae bacterium]